MIKKTLEEKQSKIKQIFQKTKGKKSSFGSWYKDNYNSVILQRNIFFGLFVIALIGVIIAFTVFFAVNKMQKLEPFIVEIEKKTGIVSVVDQSSMRNFSSNDAINNYFIVKFLRLWEIFDNENYKYNYYTELRLFSAPDVFNQFLAFIRLSNPISPINLYQSNPITAGDIRIRSIQYIDEGAAQVRFTTQIKTRQSERYGEIEEKSYIATIKFAYNDLKINENERYINPLGFQIMTYNKTEEYLK